VIAPQLACSFVQRNSDAVFQTKICGVTHPDDALTAVKAGADAIGLNFYSGSPRYVTLEQARAIAAAVPISVGVFVNASSRQINEIAEMVGLNWVQLHGDEPPELLAEVQKDLPIIRVRCLGQGGIPAIQADLEACAKQGREPAALLIDATVPGEYGGTGKIVDWAALANYRHWLGEIPLILAGGLRPDNVAEAIATVWPSAVDTASGVESSPGAKDAAQVQAFISAAITAFLGSQS